MAKAKLAEILWMDKGRIEQGLENARRETMEAQLDRIAEMLGDVVRRAER